jgi:predicted ATPase/serine/threonine protein kinase
MRTTTSPTRQLQSTRFELRRLLGKGGMGVVYEAYDRQTGSVVALKTLQDLSAEALLRFKNEFRALADLQHPNLLRFGELHCEHDQWFFTMELVRGVEFHDYVRTAPSRPARNDFDELDLDTRTISAGPARQRSPLDAPARSTAPKRSRGYDEARLRDALRQLALAIDALHRSGCVHCDIKPSNVLVREDGHVLLLDFGLAQQIQRAAADAGTSQSVKGTPAFMAPEQITNEHVGPEADWYAFGTMLFMALTGRLPFGGSLMNMLEAKQARLAPEAAHFSDDVPADLNELCRALLERDPRERPTASEILRLFDPAAAHDQTGASATVSHDVFVGRAAELATLSMSLRDCRAGNAVSVLVEGEPGVGKSALVRHFLDEHVSTDAQAVLLTGRCYEQEVVPFKAFDTVIDSLTIYLSQLAEPEAAALLSSGVHNLATVFPVLRRVPLLRSPAPSREVDNPLALRTRAFQELKRLLAAIAARARLVLFIDDLQWADKDSMALLEHLLDQPDAPGCLLLATRRALPDEAAARESTDGSPLALLPLLRRFRRMRLRGLSAAEAEALWTQLAGDGERGAVRDLKLEALRAEAAGHPLFLSELVRYTKTHERDLPANASLQDVLWQRVCQLDEASRRFMECVALAGAPIEFQILERAAGIDAGESLQLMSALRIAQMIRVSRRSEKRLVEPYHDRVREAIVGRFEPGVEPGRDGPRRLKLHLAIGRSLRDATPEAAIDDELFTIVRHLSRGAPLIASIDERRELVALILRAARRAKLATAFEAALGYVRDAEALLDAQAKHDLRFALHKERVALEYLLGQTQAAQTHFEEALASCRSDSERAELYVLRIHMQSHHAEYAEAVEVGRQGLRYFGVQLPERPGRLAVLRELALLRYRRGRRSVAELVDLPESRDERIRCAMQVVTAMTPCAFFVDRTLMTVAQLKMVGLTIQYGATEHSAFGFVGYGMALSGGLGQYDKGFELGELAIRLNHRFACIDDETKIYSIVGMFLTPWVRPYSEALAQLKHAYEASLQNGDTSYRVLAIGQVALMTELSAPHVDEVVASAKASVEVAHQQRYLDMTGAYEMRLFAYAGLRDPKTNPATPWADNRKDEQLLAGLSDEQTPLTISSFYGYRSTMSYFLGNYEEARRDAAEAEKRDSQLFLMVALVSRYFYRALIGAALLRQGTADPAQAHRWLKQGVTKMKRWAKACPQNFRGRCLLVEAESARVAGHHSRAAARYRAAAAEARKQATPGIEALALELEARHLRDQGDDAQAAARMGDAIAAYERWGALAKVEQLRRLCARDG